MPNTATSASTPASQAAAARIAEIRPPGARPQGASDADPVLSDEDVKKAKKKKRMKIIAIVVVVLLVGFEAKGKVMKPHYGPGHLPAAGPIIGLGSVTTNLSDGHLAQIGISMQMTAAVNAKAEGKLSSALVGDTVAILGQQSYGSLLPPQGRAALRAELLGAYQRTLGMNEGAQQVSGVYFTSFVLQ